MQVKPLEWDDWGGGYVSRAPALFFGSFRVERYGSSQIYEAVWSVPGYCDTFIEGQWHTSGEAKAAVQAEYERRILAALLPPAPTTGDDPR